MQLKDEKRAGAQQLGVDYPESVAAHSFGTALLVWLIGEENDNKAIKMALIHDIHEGICGDTISVDMTENELQQKRDEELAAFNTILGDSELERTEFEQLWREYEAERTDTARFVHDIDILDRIIQAYIYEKNGRWGETKTLESSHSIADQFFEGVRNELHHPVSKQLFDKIHNKYLNLKEK